MNSIRKHWFDLGVWIALMTIIHLYRNYEELNTIELVMYIQFIVLLIHQFEEYRYPGFFPGMLNKHIFKSEFPDRYPLNTQSALLINVIGGWGLYFMAAMLNTERLLLCLITVVISLLNALAHLIFLNIKIKRIYNPGVLSSTLGFIPICCYFFYWTWTHNLLNQTTWILGIVSGLIVSIGIPLLVLLLSDKNSVYRFAPRQIPD